MKPRYERCVSHLWPVWKVSVNARPTSASPRSSSVGTDPKNEGELGEFPSCPFNGTCGRLGNVQLADSGELETHLANNL